MFRNPLPTILVVLLVIFDVSCSQGKSGITTPDIDGAKDEAGGWGTKYLAGLWHVQINPATGSYDIASLRSSELILNVLGFLEPPPLSGVNIDLDSLVIEPPEIQVDVILSHPIPDPVFMGFDVRGVVFGPRVTNSDGMTILTGPEFFKNEPFGYIDGLLGAPDNVANYEGLAGYKYFCDGLGKDADLVTFMSNAANLSRRRTPTAGTTSWTGPIPAMILLSSITPSM
jgi:hypothetical protein